ncbi:hypothetical protein ROZALSC1DRAFT_22343, partial [Rozella allomycis CSF55]
MELDFGTFNVKKSDRHPTLVAMQLAPVFQASMKLFCIFGLSVFSSSLAATTAKAPRLRDMFQKGEWAEAEHFLDQDLEMRGICKDSSFLREKFKTQGSQLFSLFKEKRYRYLIECLEAIKEHVEEEHSMSSFRHTPYSMRGFKKASSVASSSGSVRHPKAWNAGVRSSWQSDSAFLVEEESFQNTPYNARSSVASSSGSVKHPKAWNAGVRSSSQSDSTFLVEAARGFNKASSVASSSGSVKHPKAWNAGVRSSSQSDCAFQSHGKPPPSSSCATKPMISKRRASVASMSPIKEQPEDESRDESICESVPCQDCQQVVIPELKYNEKSSSSQDSSEPKNGNEETFYIVSKKTVESFKKSLKLYIHNLEEKIRKEKHALKKEMNDVFSIFKSLLPIREYENLNITNSYDLAQYLKNRIEHYYVFQNHLASEQDFYSNDPSLYNLYDELDDYVEVPFKNDDIELFMSTPDHGARKTADVLPNFILEPESSDRESVFSKPFTLSTHEYQQFMHIFQPNDKLIKKNAHSEEMHNLKEIKMESNRLPRKTNLVPPIKTRKSGYSMLMSLKQIFQKSNASKHQEASAESSETKRFDDTVLTELNSHESQILNEGIKQNPIDNDHQPYLEESPDTNVQHIKPPPVSRDPVDVTDDDTVLSDPNHAKLPMNVAHLDNNISPEIYEFESVQEESEQNKIELFNETHEDEKKDESFNKLLKEKIEDNIEDDFLSNPSHPDEAAGINNDVEREACFNEGFCSDIDTLIKFYEEGDSESESEDDDIDSTTASSKGVNSETDWVLSFRDEPISRPREHRMFYGVLDQIRNPNEEQIITRNDLQNEKHELYHNKIHNDEGILAVGSHLNSIKTILNDINTMLDDGHQDMNKLLRRVTSKAIAETEDIQDLNTSEIEERDIIGPSSHKLVSDCGIVTPIAKEKCVTIRENVNDIFKADEYSRLSIPCSNVGKSKFWNQRHKRCDSAFSEINIITPEVQKEKDSDVMEENIPVSATKENHHKESKDLEIISNERQNITLCNTKQKTSGQCLYNVPTRTNDIKEKVFTGFKTLTNKAFNQVAKVVSSGGKSIIKGLRNYKGNIKVNQSIIRADDPEHHNDSVAGVDDSRLYEYDSAVNNGGERVDAENRDSVNVHVDHTFTDSAGESVAEDIGEVSDWVNDIDNKGIDDYVKNAGHFDTAVKHES